MRQRLELSADWRRIPLRRCRECPKLVPATQDRCKSHERKEPIEYVIRDSSGRVLDRWVESDEDPSPDECDYGEECPANVHDMGCYHEPLPVGMREYMGLPLQDAINAAHERLTAAQRGVFLRKSAECPPRMEGDKPHCPDCSGIVGETGIVW